MFATNGTNASGCLYLVSKAGPESHMGDDGCVSERPPRQRCSGRETNPSTPAKARGVSLPIPSKDIHGMERGRAWAGEFWEANMELMGSRSWKLMIWVAKCFSFLIWGVILQPLWTLASA